jgi:hypothetical protein
MARKFKVRKGKERKGVDKERQKERVRKDMDKTRKGKERKGNARKVKERKGKARQGKARKGKESQGKARHSSLTTKMNHKIQEYHNNHKMKPKFQSIINMKYFSIIPFTYLWSFKYTIMITSNTDGIH